MVGDEGKPHWIDVQEAERRKEDASEDEGRHQGTPADALLQGEKNEDEEPRRCRKSILPRRRVIDFPAGIDEDQGVGPDELARIEPKGSPCDEESVGERKGEIRPLRPHLVHLQHGGPQSHRGSKGEHSGKRRKGPLDQIRPPPPENQNENGGKGSNDCLTEKGADEAKNGESQRLPSPG